MKLKEKNNIAFIKNYLMRSLPKLEGKVNLRNALRKATNELLTPAAGDRPDAWNICIIMTCSFKGVRKLQEFQRFKQKCKRIFVLKDGSKEDLEKVCKQVCPAANNFKGTFLSHLIVPGTSGVTHL